MTEYVAKIKVPKNCFFCKHLSFDYEDREFTSNPNFYVCDRPDGDYSTKMQKTGDVQDFEKNMKFHKRCYEPLTELPLVSGRMSVKVKIQLEKIK